MESPCVNQCCLDEDDICVGCFRHINEICGWSEASEARQQEILDCCQQRKQQAQFKLQITKHENKAE